MKERIVLGQHQVYVAALYADEKVKQRETDVLVSGERTETKTLQGFDGLKTRALVDSLANIRDASPKSSWDLVHPHTILLSDNAFVYRHNRRRTPLAGFQTLLGLGSGALIAGIALGVVLTYRGSGIINLATGGVAMFAGYAFWALTTDLLHLSTVPALLLVGACHRPTWGRCTPPREASLLWPG